ncbi:CU044_5270 family protein [Actinomadura rubrisoli]|uniref:CU044_5270 family protein n=1 Tax=Actinomadura rubrisoli TaxID=2530368 RepID=UPI0014050766|nr:CU044_5270 family protein [Actinomadura rubrisoli]
MSDLNGLNDLDVLRDAWGSPEPPPAAARAAARAALLDRASAASAAEGSPATVPVRPVPDAGSEPVTGPAGERRRRFRLPRLGVRVAAVGALAAAIAIGVTVVQSSGGTDEHGRPRPVVPGVPAAPVANASEALERAAHAAEARPFIPPRPDQWIYTEARTRTGKRPNGSLYKDPKKTVLVRSWHRADGKATASYEGGKLVLSGTMPTTPPSDYASLAALPTEPDALLKWLYKEMGGLGDSPEGRYATAYSMLGAILRDNVLPPAREAAVFRTIKRIPGVALVPGRVDAAGRPALGLGRVAEGWLHEELLLDPVTYAYLGERSVALKNHTSRGDDGSVSVRKGELQNLTVRTKAGIVDKAGQLP